MACAKVVSDFELLTVEDAGRRRAWTDKRKRSGSSRRACAAIVRVRRRRGVTGFRRDHSDAVARGISRRAAGCGRADVHAPGADGGGPVCAGSCPSRWIGARRRRSRPCWRTGGGWCSRHRSIPRPWRACCRCWKAHDRVSGKCEGLDRGRGDGHALRHEQPGAEGAARAWPRSAWRGGLLLSWSPGRSGEDPLATLKVAIDAAIARWLGWRTHCLA